jgi:hypothetical protein
MLGKVFARFVEKSPISVMVRGTLERVLDTTPRLAYYGSRTCLPPLRRVAAGFDADAPVCAALVLSLTTSISDGAGVGSHQATLTMKESGS